LSSRVEVILGSFWTDLGGSNMFGRKRGIDAKRLIPIMVEAFAAERFD
jgi:hypothetical protein